MRKKRRKEMKDTAVKEIILYGISLGFFISWYNLSKQLFAWCQLLVEVQGLATFHLDTVVSLNDSELWNYCITLFVYCFMSGIVMHSIFLPNEGVIIICHVELTILKIVNWNCEMIIHVSVILTFFKIIYLLS